MLGPQRSPLRFLHRLSYCQQQALAKFAPIVVASLGALVFIVPSPFGTRWQMVSSVGACACWGAGLKIGVGAKFWMLRIIRRSIAGPPGPSWTLAAFVGLLLTGLWATVFQHRSAVDVGGALAVALHVTYAGAKLHCRINRCCEPHRNSWIREVLLDYSLFLQDIEILVSLLIAMLMFVLWSNQIAVAGALGFVLHAVVRGVDWHARFPWRGPLQLMSDLGCGGFVVLALIFLVLR